MIFNSTDFGEFYRGLHDDPPFLWQTDLAKSVFEKEVWPEVIALPTASGKTALMDIALYALAHGVACAARRIFFCVDRRIVVDEAGERARRIAAGLRKALVDPNPFPAVRFVADRLAALGGEGNPLTVATMRGATVRDDAWSGSPAQPAVCCSTVRQVGSRLLFRGQGIKQKTWPIHAGLVGSDALVIVDEAHCSQPFVQTLQAVAARYQSGHVQAGTKPISVVQMTATPQCKNPYVAAGIVDERLAPRFERPKYTSLAVVGLKEDSVNPKKPVGKKPPESLFLELPLFFEEAKEVKALPAVESLPSDGDPGDLEQQFCLAMGRRAAREASSLVGSKPDEPQVIGVILNRLSAARAAFALLQSAGETVVLLTGRVRPWERDELLREYKPKFSAGRRRNSPPSWQPIFVVATQCIEVGADLDFDAMVTECASYDALLQRLGRVNRLGTRPDAKVVVLIREDQVPPIKGGEEAMPEDPIYGYALARTWQWLSARTEKLGKKRLDLSVKARSDNPLQGGDFARLCAPTLDAPILLPAHLDLWSQTSPVPVPDPDIDVFLYGPRAGVPDVNIVWRADFDVSFPDDWVPLAAVCPPTGAEMMQVPFLAARHWLQGLAPIQFTGDVEGSPETLPLQPKAKTVREDAPDSAESESADDEESVEESSEGNGHDHGSFDERSVDGDKAFLRWAGRKDSYVVASFRELRPGDTIIVPSQYGGADRFGWKPASTQVSVSDLGDRLSLFCRGRAVLRIATGSMRACLHPGGDAPVYEQELALVLQAIRVLVLQRDEVRDEAALDRRLRELSSLSSAPRWLRASARLLAEDSRREVRVVRANSDDEPLSAALVGSRRLTYDQLWSVLQKIQAAPDQVLSDDMFEGEFDGYGQSCPLREIGLDEHQRGVAARARFFAERCCLSPSLVETLAAAGRWHDVGKHDPRFQAWLRRGSRSVTIREMARGAFLAKSDMDPRDWKLREQARILAGYPRGERHELESLALVCPDRRTPVVALPAEVEADLFLHLIATHHGYCRPFAPIAEQSGSVEVVAFQDGQTLTADSDHRLTGLAGGIPERYWRLNRRYGWHGLAFLESILRLADQRQSQEEQVAS